MMTLTQKLICLSDLYCQQVQRSRSRISTLIFGDGLRLDGIASGKDLNTRSYEKAMLWFAANWPEATPWPDGIDRPEPADESAHDASSESQGAAA